MKRRVTIVFIITAVMLIQFCIFDNVISDTAEGLDYIPAPIPLGDKGIWIFDISGGGGITLDGDLSDLQTEGVPHDIFNGVDVYLAFDAVNVYVAAQWLDMTEDDSVSHWNKTRNINATHDDWEQFGGEDDVLTVGFSDGSDTDLWVWTNSFRTESEAYEMDLSSYPDLHNLPFIRNIDGTGTMPLFDNTTLPIINHLALPVGTVYTGWFDDTPSGSQADVDVVSDYNNTEAFYYTIEFSRPLDTGYTDDIMLDFSVLTNLSFFVGAANNDDAQDMIINVEEFSLASGNDPSEFFWNVIMNPVTESIVISGTCYDDYKNYDFKVRLSGWENSYDIDYGYEFWDDVDVNVITGNWSYLLQFNDEDMPLGDQTINVTFAPKYEAPFVQYQNVSIDDILAPQIVGIVDLNERYPTGVPIDTDYVAVTVGVVDNYDITNDLSVQLYYYKDDGIALMIPMQQFTPGGTTFDANITLEYDQFAENNYTYFVQVFDTSNNKVQSEHYWFILGQSSPNPTPTPTPTNTTEIPTITIGYQFFSVISLGLVIFSMLAFIGFRRIRKKK